MKKKGLTTAAGAPVVDNNNVMTAGKRGPMLLQDCLLYTSDAADDLRAV